MWPSESLNPFKARIRLALIETLLIGPSKEEVFTLFKFLKEFKYKLEEPNRIEVKS
ncbi:hypothetical protein MY3296_001425 [Beauveria thailandica]